MTWILALDLLDGNYGGLKAVEGKQPVSGWNMSSNAGVLHDNRAPGCQITGAPIAKPASSASSIALLDSGQFSAGAKDVITVAIGICDLIRRRGKLPAVFLKRETARLVRMDKET
jgi:hypothetical protein